MWKIKFNFNFAVLFFKLCAQFHVSEFENDVQVYKRNNYLLIYAFVFCVSILFIILTYDINKSIVMDSWIVIYLFGSCVTSIVLSIITDLDYIKTLDKIRNKTEILLISAIPRNNNLMRSFYVVLGLFIVNSLIALNNIKLIIVLVYLLALFTMASFGKILYFLQDCNELIDVVSYYTKLNLWNSFKIKKICVTYMDILEVFHSSQWMLSCLFSSFLITNFVFIVISPYYIAYIMTTNQMTMWKITRSVAIVIQFMKLHIISKKCSDFCEKVFKLFVTSCFFTVILN